MFEVNGVGTANAEGAMLSTGVEKYPEVTARELLQIL